MVHIYTIKVFLDGYYVRDHHNNKFRSYMKTKEYHYARNGNHNDYFIHDYIMYACIIST